MPWATVAPAFGLWPMTMPFGLVAALRTSLDFSFACCSWNCADCYRMPTTFGTVVFEFTITVVGFDEW